MAICLLLSAAGSLAGCFYSDCNTKHFGTVISEYLIDNDSKVVPAPAKHQSSNGLVESHWKVMDHLSCAYLMEKQMPYTFWFYAITHVACVMNTVPSKLKGCLASPFLLVHGVVHNKRTWIPLFAMCYFHHKKDGDK